MSPLLSKVQFEEAAEMWRDGFNTYDIAEALQITEASVWNQLGQIKRVARLLPQPPDTLDHAIGGAAQILPAIPIALVNCQERQIDRLAVIAHQRNSIVHSDDERRSGTCVAGKITPQ